METVAEDGGEGAVTKRVRVRGYVQKTMRGRPHIVLAHLRRRPRQKVYVQRKGFDEHGLPVIVTVEVPMPPQYPLGGREVPQQRGVGIKKGQAVSDEEMGLGGGGDYDNRSREGNAETSARDNATLEEPLDKFAITRMLRERERRERAGSIFLPSPMNDEEVYRDFYGDLPIPRVSRKRREQR